MNLVIRNKINLIDNRFDHRIIVRASVDIEKDEMLTACYTYTMSGTSSRQDHLKKGKYFICEKCLVY